MNPPSNERYVLPRWLRPWEEFWFTPADPAVLALMRICAGMIVVYTLFVYSFTLQEFMGEHSWHDLKLRRNIVENRPVQGGSLHWTHAGPLPEPVNDWQKTYKSVYRRNWGIAPPPPYPAEDDLDMVSFLHSFRTTFSTDLRINGLKLPTTLSEKEYAWRYTQRWGIPPPAYVQSQEEEDAINDYMMRENGIDPRRVYAKGMPVWSIWFHVTDPTAMGIVHALIVFSAFLFMIGFGTRITTALVWFGSLSYIHRNPSILFGVDTMMTILLFYLMFSPCGEVYSVDRCLRRWWIKAKPGVVQWWYQLLRLQMPTNIAPADPVPEVPTPSVSANFVIRLLQVHVCIIYLMSGLSKLQGNAWWNGTAVWMTLGNYEFAPMQFDIYLGFLRFLGGNQMLYDACMTGSGLFTLSFEIGYAFLIWRPRLRWIFLAAAIMLHAGIGLLMGLKTFSLMMLVLNMAFLRKEEVYWIFSFLANPRGKWQGASAAPTQPTVAAPPVATKAS